MSFKVVKIISERIPDIMNPFTQKIREPFTVVMNFPVYYKNADMVKEFCMKYGHTTRIISMKVLRYTAQKKDVREPDF